MRKLLSLLLAGALALAGNGNPALAQSGGFASVTATSIVAALGGNPLLLSGTLTTDNLVKASGVGTVVDSGQVLVTTICAGCSWTNPTSGTAPPTASAVINTGLGTVGAPVFANYTDPTTGIYFPTSTTMALGTTGRRLLQLGTVGASLNYVELLSNNIPLFRAVGTSIPLTLAGSGTAGVKLYTNSGGTNPDIARFSVSGSVGTQVNYLEYTATSTGVDPTLYIAGDTNRNFKIGPAGTGTLAVQNLAGTASPISTAAYIAKGSAPTPTGTCAVNTQTGGNTAGTFKANGACAAGTVILTFATTAPTGWACNAKDQTTAANLMNQTANTTTTATFTGTMTNLDVVAFSCLAF